MLVAKIESFLEQTIHHSPFTNFNMDSERWQQIKSALDAALDEPVSERRRILAERCGADAELLREAASLLDFETEAEVLEDAKFSDLSPNGWTNPFIGRRVGKYRIVSEIGAGGMGAVFLAVREEDEFEQTVAVKFLRHGFSSGAARQRFRLERQILARLSHPYIAQFLDGGTGEDGTPYLVMEYIVGTPITRYAADKNLALEERLNLFRKVCEAVSFAHRNLIVHRDLKPDNILVTGEGAPKLLDFGIAKLLSSDEIHQTVTRQQALTPEYASPEQTAGEAITTASDVYSLGIVLYELLTGAHPFRKSGASVEEIQQAISRREPSRPSAALNSKFKIQNSKSGGENPKSKIQNPKSLRGDLDNIVLKALKKNPEKRYASVDEFSRDLKFYLKGFPVSARPDTFFYRAGKFLSRNPLATAAVLIAVVSLIAGTLTATHQARLANIERTRAERRFEDVRQLAKSLINEFPQAVDRSAVKAKELLVRRSLEYLDALSKEAEDDRLLQRELAAAYLQIGDLQGKPNAENLGDTAGALESYRKSAAILEKLISAEPDNLENRRDLSSVYENFGMAQSVTSDYAAALEFFRRSMTIRESLIENEPANHEYRRLFADSLRRAGDALGSVMRLNGNDEVQLLQQLANYERALALQEELLKLNPQGNPENRAVAITHQRIGSCLSRLGEQTENPERFRQALTNHQRALDVWILANPTDAEGRFPAGQHKHIGGALRNLGDTTSALAKYERARAIFKRLAAADPNNVEYQRELANLNFETAVALTKTGDSAAAIADYRHGLEIFERLAASDPARVTDNYSVMTTAYKELGELLEKQNNRREAVKNYQKAFDYGERWLTIAPGNDSITAQQSWLKQKIEIEK